MKYRFVRTIASLALGAAIMPLSGGAHAETPLACFGSPSTPDAYACFVRFQVGVDTPPQQQPVDVNSQSIPTPSQTVTVPAVSLIVPSQTIGSQTVGVGPTVIPARTVNLVPGTTVTIPQVCVVFCVGPFSQTINPIDVNVPGATVPGASVTTPAISTPGINQAIFPGFTQTIPSQTVTTPGVHETVDYIGVAIPPGAAAVLWYKGKCYYVFPNGTVTTASSSTPFTCP